MKYLTSLHIKIKNEIKDGCYYLESNDDIGQINFALFQSDWKLIQYLMTTRNCRQQESNPGTSHQD